MLERIYASTDDEHAFTDDLLSFCMHCTHLANWIECDRYVPSRSKHIVAQALTTPPTVHQMLVTLERKGLIRRKPGVARSIELLVSPASLPVLR